MIRVVILFPVELNDYFICEMCVVWGFFLEDIFRFPIHPSQTTETCIAPGLAGSHFP